MYNHPLHITSYDNDEYISIMVIYNISIPPIITYKSTFRCPLCSSLIAFKPYLATTEAILSTIMM